MAIVARASVDVPASVHRTFAVLSDPSRFHEWQAGMQPAQADTGPIGPGSRLTSRRTYAGVTVAFTSEVTTWEPPHRLGFRSVRTPLRVIGDYVVTAAPVGSRVDASLEIAVPRFAPLRIGAQAEQLIAGQLQADLESLAGLVPAGSTDRPASGAATRPDTHPGGPKGDAEGRPPVGDGR